MTIVELIEQARECAKVYTDNKCVKCNFKVGNNGLTCVDRLINALADKLEIAYEDIKVFGKASTLCLGCKHLKDINYDCSNNCIWQWKGDTE